MSSCKGRRRGQRTGRGKPTVPSWENEQMKPEIYEKFLKYLTNRRKKFLKDRLCEYYGKNFTVNYKPHYDFEEEWEDRLTRDQTLDHCDYHEDSFLHIGYSALTILVVVVTVWLSTLDFFFRNQPLKAPFFSEVCWVAVVGEVGYILVTVRRRISRLSYDSSGWEVLEAIYKNVICVAYLCLKIADVYERRTLLWTSCQLVTIYLMYSRASMLYQSLRFASFSLQYEYQSKVLDLIVTLLMILHVVSIILYSATRLNPDQNWMSSLTLSQDEFTHYLYSFYFGSTTVLTVGYGDLSPSNPHEVAIVTVIEIFGIVMFAYIINEIGYSISTLRKGRETVEKDLSTLEKIKKHYKMSDVLMNRARAYLINHKPKFDQLAPQEENRLVMKFNEELRNDMAKENSLAVVKTSIFFLCRWTKAFQKAVSMRLTHVLFSPNDIVYQPPNQQRIYIIRVGRINVYAERNGRKKGINNLLKTIDTAVDHHISDNCYGYTAAISTRPTRLYAYAKDFTSAYFIDKQAFLDCANERSTDFEYLHEIKSKFDESLCWEAFEAPLLESSKHHYNPTKITLIRKHCQNNPTTERRTLPRGSRASFRGLKYVHDHENMEAIRYRLQTFESAILDPIEEHEPMPTAKHLNLSYEESSGSEKGEYTHFQEVSREYSNYFPRRNLEKVLQRYENEYFLPLCDDNQRIELSMKVYQSARMSSFKAKPEFIE